MAYLKYHLFVPELITVITFPILGYILTYEYNSLLAYRITFFIFGVGLALVSLIPFKVLKYVPPTKIKKEEDNKHIHISSNLYVVAAAEILFLIASQCTTSFVTIYYILDKINGNLFYIMILETAVSLTSVVSGLLLKNLNKYLSKQKACQIGIIIYIIYTFLMFVSHNFILVFLANIINTIGHIIWFPNQSALIMDFVPQKQRGEFFASISSISKLFTVIIPIIVGFIATNLSFNFVFAIAMVLYVIILVLYNILIKRANI